MRRRRAHLRLDNPLQPAPLIILALGDDGLPALAGPRIDVEADVSRGVVVRGPRALQGSARLLNRLEHAVEGVIDYLGRLLLRRAIAKHVERLDAGIAPGGIEDRKSVV